MPYKDPARKMEWERLHRPQRLARRRELRRIAAPQHATRPEATTTAKMQHYAVGSALPSERCAEASFRQPATGGFRKRSKCLPHNRRRFKKAPTTSP
jgi:hypothetical protein